MTSKRSWATRLSAAVLCVPLATPVGQRPHLTADHIRLSADDDGRSIHVLPGSSIELELRPDSDGGYRTPRSDRPDVLRETDRSEDSRGAARATFIAVRPGYALIVSEREPACGDAADCDAGHPYEVQIAVDHAPQDSTYR